MKPFDYGTWIKQQHDLIRDILDAEGRRAGYRQSVALYALPSNGAVAGKLIVSDAPVLDGIVVRFPAQGSAVMAVPRSHLESALWHACRSLPICPTA